MQSSLLERIRLEELGKPGSSTIGIKMKLHVTLGYSRRHYQRHLLFVNWKIFILEELTLLYSLLELPDSGVGKLSRSSVLGLLLAFNTGRAFQNESIRKSSITHEISCGVEKKIGNFWKEQRRFL